MREMREAGMASLEAEQSVLGALMLDNAAFDRVGHLLQAEHFTTDVHRAAWTALERQISACKAADALTVFDELRARKVSPVELEPANDAGMLAYLNALCFSVVGAAHVERYAKIVIDRHRSRLLSAAGATAWELAGDQSVPIDERIERVSAELMKLLEQGAQREPVPATVVMAQTIDRINERATGVFDSIPTGLDAIDEMLGGGLAPSNLVILAGRPGMGKTAMALGWMLNIAQARPVGFLSMEMSHAELGDRMVASAGRVDLKLVKRPPAGAAELFWARVASATEKVAGLQLVIDDQGGLTLAQVRAKARAMRRLHRIELLVVDYLQLMEGRDPKMMRTYQLEEISRGLKTLAKDLNLPVVALAQVSREAERRLSGYPTMADLKDCGAIEQDADVVFFIHRPVVLDPELGADFRYFAKGIFSKNRQGPTGTVNLSYLGHETRFGAWAGEEPERPGRSKTKGFG